MTLGAVMCVYVVLPAWPDSSHVRCDVFRLPHPFVAVGQIARRKGCTADCFLQPVGSTTPGSNVKIEETILRGEISSGMLCSAFDLGWLDLPDGVFVELPDHIDEGETVGSTPIEVSKGTTGVVSIFLLFCIQYKHTVDEFCQHALPRRPALGEWKMPLPRTVHTFSRVRFSKIVPMPE